MIDELNSKRKLDGVDSMQKYDGDELKKKQMKIDHECEDECDDAGEINETVGEIDKRAFDEYVKHYLN